MDPNPLDDWTRAARAVTEERRETRTNLYRRTGVVASASVDGECTVQLGAVGAAVPAAILGGGSLAVGDVVIVDVWQGEVLVLGQTGSSGYTAQLWTRASQTISNNSLTQWGFNASEFDVGAASALWSNSGGTLTVHQAGVYRLDFGFRWALNNPPVGRRLHSILVDGTSIVRNDDAASQTQPADHIGRLRFIPAGGVVTCEVLQSSGAAGGLGFGGDPMTFFSIEAAG